MVGDEGPEPAAPRDRPASAPSSGVLATPSTRHYVPQAPLQAAEGGAAAPTKSNEAGGAEVPQATEAAAGEHRGGAVWEPEADGQGKGGEGGAGLSRLGVQESERADSGDAREAWAAGAGPSRGTLVATEQAWRSAPNDNVFPPIYVATPIRWASPQQCMCPGPSSSVVAQA